MLWIVEGQEAALFTSKPLRFSIGYYHGQFWERHVFICVVVGRVRAVVEYDRNLVDPASSHMLVSKIKPCMSKYKHFILWNCEWLIKSVIVYLIIPYYLDNRGNSSANTCFKPRLLEGVYLLDKKPIVVIRLQVNHDNYSNRIALLAMVHSNFCPITFRW